jgi:predicted Zn-dependent peptidase
MIDKITLPNGVRLVSERIGSVRSASLGVWIGAGARHEAAAASGVSHFIEHMVFKGSDTRSAADLAAFMDSVGGQINAFTSKECTCFHGRVIDARLREFAETLSDMLLRARFDEADVASERGVILEEIGMYEDTPEDVAAESLARKMFRGSSLGRPILGSAATLSRMTGASLRKYQQSRYRGGAIVVSLSGSFTDDDARFIAEQFSRFPPGEANEYVPAAYTPSVSLRRKVTEQNHLIVAFPGIAMTDDRRYPAQMMSDILGGGMSSRLFQQVRETRGLCYSIYSALSAYMDTGVFSISTALSAETEQQALRVITDEIKRMRDGGVTEAELLRAREEIRSTLLLALESTSARMNRLGRNELFFGRAFETEETLARYEAVTRDDIARIAEELLNFENVSLSVAGHAKRADAYLSILHS